MSPPIGPVPYCSTGFQYPRTGNNFVGSGFYCNTCGRLYPRNRLKAILKPNKTYCAKYYVVNTNNNYVAIDKYGAYFEDSSMDTIHASGVPLTYLTPQIEHTGSVITDTLRWTAISGTFVATGAEKYMLLGNFKTNAATNTLALNMPTPAPTAVTNDIYIDDVSLIEMDLPAFAGRDTIVHPGDSVFIGRESDIGIDEACIWYKLPDMTNPIDTIAGFWINPTTTATYVVKQQLWCTNTPKWDTVLVIADATVGSSELRVSGFGLELFPNPADEVLELNIKNAHSDSPFKKISVFNSLGQLIREESPIAMGLRTTIGIADLAEGVYLLYVSGSQGSIQRRFVISR